MKTSIDSRSRGSYILLIEISDRVNVKVGALGPVTFPQGFYAYCGSAMGGLGARINRHVRREKKIHWHVDYLLAEGRIKGMMSAITSVRLECQLAQKLEKVFHFYPGFGSSDCGCPSHLFFSEEFPLLQEKTAAVFRALLKGGALIVEEC